MGGKPRKGYSKEIDLLPATYRLVANADLSALAAIVMDLAEGPAVYVASGGALAVARFGASLHEQYSGHPAKALTPLEFSTIASPRQGAVVISASGRNPDAAMAVQSAIAREFSRVALLTCRAPDELPRKLVQAPVLVARVPSAAKRDGFLATNSIIALSSGLACVWTKSSPDLDFTPRDFPLLRKRCLILHSPVSSTVAIDIETRLSESGLASAQLADYRNFAHGRHFGFFRHLDETTIIALVDPAFEDLCNATLKELPASAQVVRLQSVQLGPFGVVELLGQAISLIETSAYHQGVTLGRPGVPLFGRRLYHLPVSKLVDVEGAGPVDRKVRQLGVAGSVSAVRADYSKSLSSWLRVARSTRLSAVVLDYDGTCCTTADRFELPPPSVQSELLRMLDLGLTIGFASGRGKSLHEDLRKWVPSTHWGNIHLCLYNGGVRLLLAESMRDQTEVPPNLLEASRRIGRSELGRSFLLEQRSTQLGVQPGLVPVSTIVMAGIVRDAIQETPCLNLKVVCSGHSVDVIPMASCKSTLVLDLERDYQGAVLAIGDQGQLGGNDYGLLAATPLSLSVDRCSTAASRCWNLSQSKIPAGPERLVGYLRAVALRTDGVVFAWKGR